MISFHIVSYNKTKHLINAVESIRNQENLDYEILILECGDDQDNIKAFLRYRDGLEDEDKILYFPNGNLGLAGGLNWLHTIQNSATRYIVEMNEDMFFDLDCIHKMVERLNDSSIGLVCANLVEGGLFDKLNPRTVDLHKFYQTPLHETSYIEPHLPYVLTEWFYEKLSHFDVWSNQMPLPFNKYGGIWDESIDPFNIGWHADWDIYQRVVGLGKKIVIQEDAWAYHYGSCSGGPLNAANPLAVKVSQCNYQLKYGTISREPVPIIKHSIESCYPRYPISTIQEMPKYSRNPL